MSRNQSKDKLRLLEQLRKMPIVEAACRQAGLPRATYYRWRKEDEVFAEACDEAIEQSAGKINDLAESQLITAIKEKNMTAIMFWLKHHHKAYVTRVNLQGTFKHHSEALTPEQSELVERALKLAGLMENKERDDEPAR